MRPPRPIARILVHLLCGLLGSCLFNVVVLMGKAYLGWTNASWFTLMMIIITFSPVFVFQIMVVVLAMRFHKAQGLLCPHCSYDLRNLPEPGRCPECGRHFDHKSIRECWAPYLMWKEKRA